MIVAFGETTPQLGSDFSESRYEPCRLSSSPDLVRQAICTFVKAGAVQSDNLSLYLLFASATTLGHTERSDGPTPADCEEAIKCPTSSEAPPNAANPAALNRTLGDPAVVAM
jgi:hypothetical protein